MSPRLILYQLLGASALAGRRVRRAAAVAFVTAAMVLGTAPLLVGPGAGRAAAAELAAKSHVTIVVMGDSYTSGEGANPQSFRTRPVETKDWMGRPYTQQQIDPAHQSATAFPHAGGACRGTHRPAWIEEGPS